MDRIDLALLRALEKDARKSYRDLAKETHVSISTVSARVKKLRDEGVVRGYTVVIDPRAVGYDLTVVIGVRIAKGKLLEVQRRISNFDSVFGVYDVTGEWDSLVLARFRTRNELDKFVKSILALEHVERTYTHLVLNTVKEEVRVPV
jgi:DNA-binding Lrp family transcriptional regulator